jgi:hypothetical protein
MNGTIENGIILFRSRRPVARGGPVGRASVHDEWEYKG